MGQAGKNQSWKDRRTADRERIRAVEEWVAAPPASRHPTTLLGRKRQVLIDLIGQSIRIAPLIRVCSFSRSGTSSSPVAPLRPRPSPSSTADGRKAGTHLGCLISGLLQDPAACPGLHFQGLPKRAIRRSPPREASLFFMRNVAAGLQSIALLDPRGVGEALRGPEASPRHRRPTRGATRLL